VNTFSASSSSINHCFTTGKQIGVWKCQASGRQQKMNTPFSAPNEFAEKKNPQGAGAGAITPALVTCDRATPKNEFKHEQKKQNICKFGSFHGYRSN
jgi:hypothetical protein